MRVVKDGRAWQVGGPDEVAWLQGRPHGCTMATSVPLVFDAYATVHVPDGITVGRAERALVEHLTDVTAEQPWWLGYLDTGAHDVVFQEARRVRLYWDWSYVLVLAGPEQALRWRTGHMRDGEGALPDLLFPQDRSWVVTALWDDTWTCVAGPAALVSALEVEPLLTTHRVPPDVAVLPPGLVRD